MKLCSNLFFFVKEFDNTSVSFHVCLFYNFFPDCIGIVIVIVTEVVQEKEDVEVLVEVAVLEVAGGLEEVAVVEATHSRGSSQVND